MQNFYFFVLKNFISIIFKKFALFYIYRLYILTRLNGQVNFIKISDEKMENKSLNGVSRTQDTLFNAFCVLVDCSVF